MWGCVTVEGALIKGSGNLMVSELGSGVKRWWVGSARKEKVLAIEWGKCLPGFTVLQEVLQRHLKMISARDLRLRDVGMKVLPGLGIKFVWEKDLRRGVSHCLQFSLEIVMHWLCTRPSVGRAASLHEACQVKPLSLPTVRPENSHIDFVGARFLRCHKRGKRTKQCNLTLMQIIERKLCHT